MSHSNRGLNEPFYRWIDDVRRAMRKEKELQEKLEFYNMKLIRYKGVSYDRIGSSGSRSSGDSELLYWLDKIDKVEHAITSFRQVVNEHRLLLNNLNTIEVSVYNDLISKHVKAIDYQLLTKTYRHQVINRIVLKWTRLIDFTNVSD
ncbi:MAG: hypothetical protein KKH92_01755 [Firmicutes bacterium]|jgi:hypothetical protein|nr:hypothetical protein [Bacillota bacterium]